MLEHLQLEIFYVNGQNLSQFSYLKTVSLASVSSGLSCPIMFCGLGTSELSDLVFHSPQWRTDVTLHEWPVKVIRPLILPTYFP